MAYILRDKKIIFFNINHVCRQIKGAGKNQKKAKTGSINELEYLQGDEITRLRILPRSENKID